MTSAPERSPRRVIWLVAAAMAVTASCGRGDDSDAATPASAGASTTASAGDASDAAPAQLDVDPCNLLTIPEMEAAIGSVELGGLEDNNPATCTYSIGGDVGAGVVSITIGEPFFCSALERALDAGSLEGTNAVAVEFGDGGIVERDGGTIQFAIGGGCIASASLMSSVV